MDERSNKKLSNIQCLRGVAVLLVVIYHLGQAESKLWPFSDFKFLSLFRFGFGGVDLFFVISGFIIAWVNYSKLGKPSEIPDYLAKRLLRIYPLYWVVFAVAATTIYCRLGIHGSVEFISLEGHLKALLLLPPNLSNLAIIPAAWSLVYEVFFYVAFMVFFLFPPRYFLTIVLVLLSSLVLVNVLVAPSDPSLKFFSNPIYIEFLLGCIAAFLIIKKTTKLAAPAIFIGVLWFVVGAVAEVKTPESFNFHWVRLVAFGIPSAMIVYGVSALEIKSFFIMPRFLSLVGDASYSIYLVHLTAFAAVRRYSHGTEVVFTDDYGLALQAGWILLMFSAAFIAGFFVHYLIEKPFLRFASRLFSKRPKERAVLAGVALTR